MTLANLTTIETCDSKSGCLNVIIETPKGSRNKFEYNPDEGLFELSKVLPKGLSFPYDFGFLPSTKGGDGDPLDVLVLMDEPTFTGCKVRCRLVGVIEGEQTNRQGKTVRNDRLIAVAEECQYDKGMRSVKQLSDNFLEELEHFFASYHCVDGEVFKALACHGPKKAEKLVREATKRFRKVEKNQGPHKGNGRVNMKK
jgi:inorganic pyrophosphatase